MAAPEGAPSGALPAEGAMHSYLTANLDSDLAYIFSEAGVALEWQYRIAHAGFRTVRRFAGLEETRTAVRQALHADLDLDSDGGLPQRLAVATIVDAWETAREGHKRSTELRAEARVSGHTRPVTHSERTAMKKVVELTVGPIPTEETPNAAYLAVKLEEVEQNEPQPTPLDEILCTDDSTDFDLSFGVDSAGAFKAIRKKVKVTMPTNSEQFRRRIRIEAHLWLFIAAKFTNRSWLQGLTRDTFDRYADFILGKKVATIEIASSSKEDGAPPIRPPWGIIMSYEYQVRKKAFDLVREENLTLAHAFKAACACSEVKELHFTTPIALAPMKRPAASADDKGSKWKRGRGDWNYDDKGDNKGQKGGRKGDRKGDGKGKKGRGRGGKALEHRTADGRMICFKFNDAKDACSGSCGMVHVCRNPGCGGAHPMYECPTLAATPK